VVSVDQLVSSTPGLVACLHGGYPTKERYIGSTVFVDQASDFSYIYHHTSLNSAQTVQAKQAFEAEAKRHGVTIKHYHADNRLFRTKPFEQDIEKKGQILSFAEVGAHHQNGIAEKRIGDLQRKATTLLLHAQIRWPDAINTYLWPYAIRCANERRNTCPTKTSALSPLNKLCQSNRKPSYRHQHRFGCPVYVLNKDNQDGKKARKWIDRTRIGINLGPSPRHASSVALILNLKTGLVSPQFIANMMTSLSPPLVPRQDPCPSPFDNSNVDSLSIIVLRMRRMQPVNQNLPKSPQISPLKMSSPLSQFKMIYPHLRNLTHLRNLIEPNQEEYLSHLKD